jgi:hypothetical protein
MKNKLFQNFMFGYLSLLLEVQQLIMINSSILVLTI